MIFSKTHIRSWIIVLADEKTKTTLCNRKLGKNEMKQNKKPWMYYE
tara:strand:- start:167 stop:304 length:138 start_codon:yes stop_codon:yes gene_type:complete